MSLLVPIKWPQAWAMDEVRYAEQTGKKQSFFTWRMEQKEEVTIVADDGTTRYVTECAANGATKEWRREQPGMKIRAERQGNTLRIAITADSERTETRFPLDDCPWYQPLSFSLRPIALAEPSPPKRFWMIRPDTLKPCLFQAWSEGVEEIGIGEETIKALKVMISPSGMLSLFWKAAYWFRPGDGLFLQYRGTHGPPGTPETVISLVPGQQEQVEAARHGFSWQRE